MKRNNVNLLGSCLRMIKGTELGGKRATWIVMRRYLILWVSGHQPLHCSELFLCLSYCLSLAVVNPSLLALHPLPSLHITVTLCHGGPVPAPSSPWGPKAVAHWSSSLRWARLTEQAVSFWSSLKRLLVTVFLLEKLCATASWKVTRQPG